MRRRDFIGASIPAYFFLAGCGGGGSSNRSSSSPTPTPTPTPTPPPPPPSPDYGQGFSPDASSGYQLYGAFVRYAEPRQFEPGDELYGYSDYSVQLVAPPGDLNKIVAARYDAVGPSLEIAQGLETLRKFGPEDYLGVYEGFVGFASEESDSEGDKEYRASLGHWSRAASLSIDNTNVVETSYDITNREPLTSPDSKTRHLDYFGVGGDKTESSDMPVEGSSNYIVWITMPFQHLVRGPLRMKKKDDYIDENGRQVGVINDFTNAMITVDWKERTISASIIVQAQSKRDGENYLEFPLGISAKFVADGPVIEGTVTGEDGKSGQVTGSVFGARGRQIGLVFTLSGSDGFGVCTVTGSVPTYE